jgi:hypothetical protein
MILEIYPYTSFYFINNKIVMGLMNGGGVGLVVNMSGNMFACCGFESRSSCHVGILASDMAYGVPRQGFDPGLQVFLCQQEGAYQLRLLFTRLDARA